MSQYYTDTREVLSQTKFYEGYSRYIEDESRYETWSESVGRVMSMHRDYYKDVLSKEASGKLNDLISSAADAYNDKLVLGAQRALQFGGEQLMKHQAKMYNCAGSYADRPEFFGEFFYMLLCGVGGGFSVQKHHVAKLPKLQQRTKQAKGFVVEDSIEGWAEAVDVLMSSYFVGGGKHPEYEGRRVYFDLNNIRPKGAKISGGFKSPGPDGLRSSLDKIEYLIQGLVINKKDQIELKPINVYDISMFIADAVLAGGIRRAATICLFSHDDEEMTKAKTGNWFYENPQRGRSNNSAVIVRDEIQKQDFMGLMDSIKQFGEPGFLFVDSTEHITNPCVEIGFFPQIDGVSGWQVCNLTEINGGMCTDEETFYKACRAASILGTLQAGYTKLKFVSEATVKILEREALLGVSITGWMNNPDILFDEKILEKGAKIVRETNEEVAALLGINPAARTTCVKPSGNASVLLGTASGIHPEHSPMYIRNVQLNKDSEVAQLIAKTNPEMVEESVWSPNKSDYVVSFPIIPKDGSLYKEDLVGVKHLELVKKVQKHWVDAGKTESRCADKGVSHNVSNTILVDDWDKVAEYVYKNRNSFAGISFLSTSGDKDFNQAPNTEVITPEQMVEKYGVAGVLAAGLVVDALSIFDDLWVACSAAQGLGEDIAQDSHKNASKKDWIRRFKSFSENYLEGDIKKTEYCLKDAYLIHKWSKIQRSFRPLDWDSSLTEKKYIEADTITGAACSGGACEIDF